MSPAKIFVVDDDPGVCSVITQLLEAHGIAAKGYSNPFYMLEDVVPTDVGCVVTDLEMPSMDGIELQSKLIEMGSCLAVVVITGHADVPRTIKVMSQGAIMLLEKPFKSGQLLNAVQRAIEVSQLSFTRRNKIRTAVRLIASLSDDELEIMKLAAKGLPNKAISLQLHLSPRTVDRRRQSALQKLDVASVADFAVIYANSQETML